MVGTKRELNEKVGLATCRFSEIETPGTYVEHRLGTLLRVPPDGVAPGRSPVIEVIATEPWIATKISDDPYLALTKAQMIAADHDLSVNF